MARATAADESSCGHCPQIRLMLEFGWSVISPVVLLAGFLGISPFLILDLLSFSKLCRSLGFLSATAIILCY